MIAAATATTEYSRPELREFAALHFAEADRVGRVHVWSRKRSSEDMYRVQFLPADQLADYLQQLRIYKQDYYLSANTFTGGDRIREKLFSYNNIVIDIDAHAEGLDDQERDRKIEGLAFFAARDLPMLPNTIVRTGRGLQLWWALEPLSAKSLQQEAAFMLLRSTITKDVRELLRDLPVAAGLTIDTAPTNNAAGLFRLPGSYNTKSRTFGFFEIVHDERLDVLQEARRISASRGYHRKGRNVLQFPKNGSEGAIWALSREDMIESLRDLRQAAGQQAGEEQRDLFLFCLYNVMRYNCDDHELIMQRILSFNEGFRVPLREHEIRSILKTSDRKNGYKLSNRALVEKMGITEAEQETLGFFERRRSAADEEGRPAEIDAEKALRDAEILRQYKQGIRQNEIAKAVGCSAQTVGRVIRKNGEKSRSEQLQERVVELYLQGAAAEEIASETGISKRSVYYRIEKARENGEILATDARKEKNGVFIDNEVENATEPTTAASAGMISGETEPRVFVRVKKIPQPGGCTIRGLASGRGHSPDPDDQQQRRQRLIEHIEANRSRRARLGISQPWDSIPLGG